MSGFTLQDMMLAYRKAKVDSYYSSRSELIKLSNYEDNLFKNLSSLLEKINGNDKDWINDQDFLGDWTVAPKKIKFDAPKSGIVHSSEEDKWEYVCINQKENNKETPKPIAEFRVMADLSIDFHVLSALWIMKVGHLYDAKLGSCAYGNRLRRDNAGRYNNLALGSFQRYYHGFSSWRSNGINTAFRELQSNRRIVAITADISSFYHKLDASFLINKKFNSEIGIKLRKEENNLHELFTTALVSWAKKSPLGIGVPVGLPASAVVANIALFSFDKLIVEQIVPLYYGRYVDDILLIMENASKFKAETEVWEWIFSRSNQRMGKYNDEIFFKESFLEKSEIIFSGDKTKIFLLHGETGKDVVESIIKQINSRASEWRALPILPERPGQIATELISATQYDGDIADNLRKTDGLTMRRAGFALKLRDFESYQRSLSPESWVDYRHAFLSACLNYVIAPFQFFDLFVYLPRIIQLSVICGDFYFLSKIVEKIFELFNLIKRDCDFSIKSLPSNVQEKYSNDTQLKFEKEIKLIIRVIMASTGRFSNLPEDVSNKIKKYIKIHDLCNYEDKLFNYDLSYIPFRYSLLISEIAAKTHGIPKSKKYFELNKDIKDALPKEIVEGMAFLSPKRDCIYHGMVFSTRPLNIDELCFIKTKNYLFEKEIDIIMLALRGFKLKSKKPSMDDNKRLIDCNNRNGKKFISVSSWENDVTTWNASVLKMQSPNILRRYSRLMKLLNNVILENDVNYLVFPELSIAPDWFYFIAGKMKRVGISVIAGVEYIHHGKRLVGNEVWVSLLYNGFGFPSHIIYRQDKQRPALKEEKDLWSLGGMVMKPRSKWKKPPIIVHGNFVFAILICSELTNINYRSALRGKIDALFVLEWNQDIDSFNALVESSALDIHAYIIQCNNRHYGDSRIRAPYKESWKRDILQIRGGISDYHVVGEIDIFSLRKFQTYKRSPSEPFKPVPDGFEIDTERKMLP